MDFTRTEHLEAVAYWADHAMKRRAVYQGMKAFPGEGPEAFIDRKGEAWKEVRSADSMLQANIGALEKNHGPTDLALAGSDSR